jgi:hypothetical protein
LFVEHAQSMSLASGSCTVIDGSDNHTGLHSYVYHDTCPYDLHLAECNENQYPIVASQFESAAKSADGGFSGCGTSVGLGNLPVITKDPVYDHSNFVSTHRHTHTTLARSLSRSKYA